MKVIDLLNKLIELVNDDSINEEKEVYSYYYSNFHCQMMKEDIVTLELRDDYVLLTPYDENGNRKEVKG